MRKLLALAIAVVVAGSSMSARAGEAHAHTMLGPNDLKWTDVPSLPVVSI
ncbi:MAG: hypothetical protein ACXW2A_19530 [Burkholderiales bacterium]